MKVTACALASVWLVAAALLGARADADETVPADLTTAKTLFDQGRALVDARRYPEACPKFELAQRLVEGIGVTLYLGDCYEQTGRLALAWSEFDKARAMAEAKHDTRARIARDRADHLWSKLSKWTVVVPPSADVAGLVVTEDGVTLHRDAYGVERPMEAGLHRIRAFAPDRAPWETSVEIPANPGSVRVEIPRLAESTPTAVPPPPPGQAPIALVAPRDEHSTRLTTQRVVGIAVFGLGIVGVATGAILGLQAKSQMDQSNASGHCQPNDHCDATGLAARASALTKATLSTVGFVGGLTCMGGGTLLFVTAPDEPPNVGLAVRPERGGGSAVLEGRW